MKNVTFIAEIPSRTHRILTEYATQKDSDIDDVIVLILVAAASAMGNTYKTDQGISVPISTNPAQKSMLQADLHKCPFVAYLTNHYYSTGLPVHKVPNNVLIKEFRNHCIDQDATAMSNCMSDRQIIFKLRPILLQMPGVSPYRSGKNRGVQGLCKKKTE